MVKDLANRKPFHAEMEAESVAEIAVEFSLPEHPPGGRDRERESRGAGCIAITGGAELHGVILRASLQHTQ
ncbi:hypothetical protein ACFC8N_04030 [Streptomyces sp. NPDC055966]|uniref:hypothetical protein n=1 Tax=unclassified Streptomyces TaxID=2593676 RepID=UPI0035DC24C8